MKSIRVWKVTAGSVDELFRGERTEVDPSNLNSLSRSLPAGAYTTFQTFEGNKVIRLRDHICRLTRTAELSGLYLVVDEGRLRGILRQLIAECGEKNYRIRITLAFEGSPGDIFISLQEMQNLPEQVYKNGVSVVTCNLQRVEPKAKRTHFIEEAESVRQRLPKEVEEAIMLSPDLELLEGLSSNFFAVRAGEIWTAEEGVLSGVTRSMALECAGRSGIPLRFEPVKIGEIGTLAEAFITSSSRGIMPVIRIDDAPVGDGAPGPVTIRLMDCYADLVRTELEAI